MIITHHIISQKNGTEYYDIFFKVSSVKDLTFEQYKEVEDLIYEKLKEIKDEH